MLSVATADACRAGGPEGSGTGGGGADGNGGIAREASSGTLRGTIGVSSGAEDTCSPLGGAVEVSIAGTGVRDGTGS